MENTICTIECNNGNENQNDIQWFKNYEKCSKTNHFEILKNEDILNYIKDIEQNCRLEVNSGDEDYAGTRRSSNCSVRNSSTRFRSLKKVKSRVKSKKNKNVERKIKRSSSRNTMDACNYCCPPQKSHFYSNPDLSVHENSRNLNTAAKKSTCRYLKPSSKENSYKYRESSPRFYGSYSRMGHRMWPAVTEMTSFEVIKDVIPESRINGSRIIDRKSAKIHTSRPLRRKKFDESIYSNIAPSNKDIKERNYVDEQKVDTRMRQLNEESDVSDFVNQKSFNKFYSHQNTRYQTRKSPALSYQAPLQNEGYRGRYISRYRYPVKRSRQPTSWGLSSRSNRLTGVPETSSLPQWQTSRWENEVGSPLKASSSIMGTLIDRNYRRAWEPKYKNNTDRRRREPGILGEHGSPCYRRPGFLRESGKLREVIRTSENKQQLGCCCENVEQDETVDCSRYCYPENVNDFAWRNFRPQFESTRLNGMNKRINYDKRKILPKSMQSRNTNRGEVDFNLSTKGDLRHETAVYDDFAFDRSETISDDIRRNDHGDKIELEDLKPHVSFPYELAYQAPRDDSSEMTREYKLSNDLKKSQEEAMETRKMLRKKATNRYPSSKELFLETGKTSGKIASESYSRLRHDEESACECKEPFHDPPAACLTGSCTCIGNSGNAKRSDSDSSRRVCTVCCCCSSSSLDETDPVKKLESFCEKVKAVNQNVFRKTLGSAFSNAARTNAQQYSYGDEQNRSEISTETATRVSKPIEKEWLTDPTRLRFAKPKHSRGKTSLEKILIYPPRGEVGPPLTLYKQSSNINCRVKGDVNRGFRYSVTYVQKFVSPSWMPSLSPQVLSPETDEECGCSADYG